MNIKTNTWAIISSRLRRREINRRKRSNAFRGMKQRELTLHLRAVFGTMGSNAVNFPTYERNGKL
tara:strand:- start:433 stop:627 length:195 start_codon:yes stop_codon:yes gene_type:complete